MYEFFLSVACTFYILEISAGRVVNKSLLDAGYI